MKWMKYDTKKKNKCAYAILFLYIMQIKQKIVPKKINKTSLPTQLYLLTLTFYTFQTACSIFRSKNHYPCVVYNGHIIPIYNG